MGGNGNGNGFMGMGGNGNRNSPSRTPLLYRTIQATYLRSGKFLLQYLVLFKHYIIYII